MAERIFTYMIRFSIRCNDGIGYNDWFWVGIVEAPNQRIAVEIAKEKYPNFKDKKLQARASGGKYAEKWRKRILAFLENGGQGLYPPYRNNKENLKI